MQGPITGVLGHAVWRLGFASLWAREGVSLLPLWRISSLIIDRRRSSGWRQQLCRFQSKRRGALSAEGEILAKTKTDFLEELPQPHNVVTCRDRDGFPLPKCQAGTYRHPSAREQCLQLYQLAEQGAEKKPQKKIKHQRVVFIGHLKIAAR